jgi:hypothetical protein
MCLVIYLGSAPAHAAPDLDHAQSVAAHVDSVPELNGTDHHQSPGSLVHCGSPMIFAVLLVEHCRVADRIGFVRLLKTRSAAIGPPPDIRPPRP